MPDHPTDDDDETSDRPVVAHDDIMRRLLDYQRQMREGEEPEVSSEVSFDEPSPAPGTELVGEAPAETHLDSPTEAPAHAAYEEMILDEPLAARETETRPTRDFREVPEIQPEVPEVHPEVRDEPPPPARRGFFRSRSPRRDVEDVPSLERATNVDDVPDFEDVAPPAPALTGAVAAELEARIAGFERTLQRLQTQASELRQTFADMAVAADERLGALEDAIAKARAERFS